MPQLLTRHIVAESYRLLAAVGGILVLVYLSNQLARYLAEIAEGRLAGDLLLSLLLLKMASVLVLLLPAALFLSLLLGLGRMYSDSEMVALAACGYGPGQLLRTALLAALPVAALTALLALFVGPRTADLADEVLIEARGRALVSAIVPGRFSQVGDGAVYHVSEVDDSGGMRGIFARLQRPDGTVVINAARAQRLPGLRVRPLPAAPAGPQGQHHPQGRCAVDRDVAGLRRATPPGRAALAHRAAGLGAGAGPARGADQPQPVYVNLLGAGRTLLGSGELAPWLGLWWAHLPPLLLAWWLLRRQLGLPFWPATGHVD
jgi:lipopolysaccharide export system permease protein